MCSPHLVKSAGFGTIYFARYDSPACAVLGRRNTEIFNVETMGDTRMSSNCGRIIGYRGHLIPATVEYREMKYVIYGMHYIIRKLNKRCIFTQFRWSAALMKEANFDINFISTAEEKRCDLRVNSLKIEIKTFLNMSKEAIRLEKSIGGFL
jgi:hypothetical protein